MPITPNFTVEDGTGLSNANSFVPVSAADQYFSDRGFLGSQYWPAENVTPNLKKACLVNATQFIDYHFRTRFKGRKLTKSQALSWPRSGAIVDGADWGNGLYLAGYGTVRTGFLIDVNEIPIFLALATIELGSKCFQLGDGTIPGILAPDIPAGEASLISLNIGRGAVAKTWRPGRTPFTTYRFVEMIISPITTNTAAMAELTRS